MSDNRVQVRLDEDTATWLDDRAERMQGNSRPEQVRVEVSTFRYALAAELRRIRLTLNQANCIADALMDTQVTSGVAVRVPAVYANVADAFGLANNDHLPLATYGSRWDIDEQALLDYLRTLGPTADHALHDAVSRWWASDHEDRVSVQGWRAVGLRVIDTDAFKDGPPF